MAYRKDDNEFLDTVREAIGADSEEQLAEHVANCPTCQHRLRQAR